MTTVAAPGEPILRDRTEEFAVLRRAATQQRNWLQGKAAAPSPATPPASDAGAAVGGSSDEQQGSSSRPPSWVGVVAHFGELESSVSLRLERLHRAHREVFAPRFGGDAEADSEDDLQAKAEKIGDETKRFIGECQRLLKTGIRVADDTNKDEVRAAENVRRHLSSRLSSLLRAFSDAQEQYAKQLKTRDAKRKQFAIGSSDVRERLEREERTGKYLAQGYSQVEITELLMMEEQAMETSREVQNILAQVNELNQMFQDMHDLVVEQGTVLDRIDYNIEQASEKVGKGLEELKKAREQQKKCAVA